MPPKVGGSIDILFEVDDKISSEERSVWYTCEVVSIAVSKVVKEASVYAMKFPDQARATQ